MRGWTDIGTPRRCFHDDGNYRPGVGVGFPVSFSLPSPSFSVSPSFLSLRAFSPRDCTGTCPFSPSSSQNFSMIFVPSPFPRRGGLHRGEERGKNEVTGEQRMWNLSFLWEFLNLSLTFLAFLISFSSFL